MHYLRRTSGGIDLLFEALGRETRATEAKDWGKKAFEGSAQLQDGAGDEIDPATAFEEVTRPIQMLSGLPASFLSCGRGDVRGQECRGVRGGKRSG